MAVLWKGYGAYISSILYGPYNMDFDEVGVRLTNFYETKVN